MTNSIDLVPADYRQELTRQRHMRWTAATICTICALVVGLSMLMTTKARALRGESEKVQTRQALVALYDEQLATLDQRLAALDEEWTLLRSLRSGLAVDDVFLMIDRALPGSDVWFTDWSFRRAGVVLPETPGGAGTRTGYFIVVTSQTGPDKTASWQVETHMNIVGQATDHAALSKFVRGLYENRQVDSVKLNQTRVREYSDRSVVDFDLAVVLYSEPAA